MVYKLVKTSNGKARLVEVDKKTSKQNLEEEKSIPDSLEQTTTAVLNV